MRTLSDNPLVTVCMASYNSSETIERAIESILRQTYENFQLLVYDAASTDSTREILESLNQQDARIRLFLKPKRQSFSQSFRNGLDDAEGRYFCLVDADDFVARDWLRTMVDQLQDATYIAAFGKLLLCDLNGDIVTDNLSSSRCFKFSASPRTSKRVRDYIMAPESEGKVNLLYSLWRLEAIRGIGAWDFINERIDDDYLFCIRALALGPIASVDSSWICRTVPSATGANSPKVRQLLRQGSPIFLDTNYSGFDKWNTPPLHQYLKFLRGSSSLGFAIMFTPFIFFRVLLATASFPKRYYPAARRRLKISRGLA